MKRTSSKPVRRQIFVLTPEEKKAVCFVLAAFVLGLITTHYRDHSSSKADAGIRAIPSPDPSHPRGKARHPRNRQFVELAPHFCNDSRRFPVV
jgi:hypothetical protein